MKICWDNLDGLRYNKRTGKWYDNHKHTFIYKSSCEYCGESFLSRVHPDSDFCSVSCSQSGDNSKWYKDGRSYDPGYYKKWWEANKDLYNKYHRLWAQNNKEARNKYNKEWSKNNKAKRNAAASKYRSIKLNQMPDAANDIFITWYYTIAKQMSDRIGIQGFYHVDHIKPLSKGGLHHEDNLQILTAHQNLSKGNNYEDIHQSCY